MKINIKNFKNKIKINIILINMIDIKWVLFFKRLSNCRYFLNEFKTLNYKLALSYWARASRKKSILIYILVCPLDIKRNLV